MRLSRCSVCVWRGGSIRRSSWRRLRRCNFGRGRRQFWLKRYAQRIRNQVLRRATIGIDSSANNAAQNDIARHASSAAAGGRVSHIAGPGAIARLSDSDLEFRLPAHARECARCCITSQSEAGRHVRAGGLRLHGERLMRTARDRGAARSRECQRQNRQSKSLHLVLPPIAGNAPPRELLVVP